MRSARETEKMIEDFSQSTIMEVRKRRKPHQKKDNAAKKQGAKAFDEDIGDLSTEWASLMERFHTKIQKMN